MATKSVFLTKGGWHTLESFWNASGTAFFLLPQGAYVAVRYGGSHWWNGFTRQKQRLPGERYIRLEVGGLSLLYARMQMHVDQDVQVTYDVYPGDVPVHPGGSF